MTGVHGYDEQIGACLVVARPIVVGVMFAGANLVVALCEISAVRPRARRRALAADALTRRARDLGDGVAFIPGVEAVSHRIAQASAYHGFERDPLARSELHAAQLLGLGKLGPSVGRHNLYVLLGNRILAERTRVRAVGDVFVQGHLRAERGVAGAGAPGLVFLTSRIRPADRDVHAGIGLIAHEDGCRRIAPLVALLVLGDDRLAILAHSYARGAIRVAPIVDGRMGDAPRPVARIEGVVVFLERLAAHVGPRTRVLRIRLPRRRKDRRKPCWQHRRERKQHGEKTACDHVAARRFREHGSSFHRRPSYCTITSAYSSGKCRMRRP